MVCRLTQWWHIVTLTTYSRTKLSAISSQFRPGPVDWLMPIVVIRHQRCLFCSTPNLWHRQHCLFQLNGAYKSGPRFNIKMSSYQYRKSHCGDKTVVRSSYLHNGISYTGKTTSLYWNDPLDLLDKALAEPMSTFCQCDLQEQTFKNKTWNSNPSQNTSATKVMADFFQIQNYALMQFVRFLVDVSNVCKWLFLMQNVLTFCIGL